MMMQCRLTQFMTRGLWPREIILDVQMILYDRMYTGIGLSFLGIV